MTDNGKQCVDCKVFAKYYGGKGDGPACMHENHRKHHEQHTGRVCPYVGLHYDNREAGDILWLGLFERLHFITPDYIRDSLHMKRSSERLKIYNRVIAGLQCEHVIRWLNRAHSKRSTKSNTSLQNKPQKRAPKPQVRNRWGKSS